MRLINGILGKQDWPLITVINHYNLVAQNENSPFLTRNL